MSEQTTWAEFQCLNRDCEAFLTTFEVEIYVDGREPVYEWDSRCPSCDRYAVEVTEVEL